MKNFLFEQYGYYVASLENNEFIIDNFKFKLIQTDFDEENILSMEAYIEQIKQNLNGVGPFIIKNKLGKYISFLLEEKYILIASYITTLNLDALYQFHKMFFRYDNYIELDKTLDVCKERIEKIEKNLNSYLRVDSITYKENLNKSMFAIGLGINSLQYLSDIIQDYTNRLYGVSIVHKRLNSFDSYDFLDPFNFVMDSPCKDIAMLYQCDMIDIYELEQVIYKYKLDVKSASFLMARILYRCDVFDYLERKKDYKEQTGSIKINIEKEISKIKKAYSLLKNNFGIRPIEWLED